MSVNCQENMDFGEAGHLFLAGHSAYYDTSSSITKWGTQISWEWFDLESPNFTHFSMTIGLTNMLDMTPLAASSDKLCRSEAIGLSLVQTNTWHYLGYLAGTDPVKLSWRTRSKLAKKFGTIWRELVTTWLWMNGFWSGAAALRQTAYPIYSSLGWILSMTTTLKGSFGGS